MQRILLLLSLGACLACPAKAQTPPSTNAAPTNPPPPHSHSGGGPGGGHFDYLTPEQKQELQAARTAALQANPNLATQMTDLRAKMKAAHEAGTPRDPALGAQMQELQDQLHQAMLKIDPNLAPIVAEIQAHQGEGHHGGGPGGPPPPPSGTPTNSAPSGT